MITPTRLSIGAGVVITLSTLVGVAALMLPSDAAPTGINSGEPEAVTTTPPSTSTTSSTTTVDPQPSEHPSTPSPADRTPASTSVPQPAPAVTAPATTAPPTTRPPAPTTTTSSAPTTTVFVCGSPPNPPCPPS